MQLELSLSLKKERKSHLNSYRSKTTFDFLGWKAQKVRMDSKAIYRLNRFYKDTGTWEKGAKGKGGRHVTDEGLSVK